ncbi:MAG: T9SS type A sorting domain-containing protein [bacterium]
MIVSPNPARKSVLICFSAQGNSFGECSIYDATGKLVTQLFVRKPIQNNLKISWDLRDKNGGMVKPGVYFVQLKTETTQNCAKLVITE